MSQETTKPADPVAIARDLLRCRSVTPAEGGALALIESLLGGAGFAVERVTFAEAGTAPVENLYARIGDSAPHLAFAGHTDVVPPGDEARWSHPPFAGEIVNGALYGRGAVDMKGGIACALAAALDHVAAHGKPRGSISFLITGDEEGVAVNGTIKLLHWAAARGERFDHCILGEPSSAAAVGDTIKVGRRGSLNGTLVVTGRQGHVAYPQLADNPIRTLTTLLTALMATRLDSGSAHFDPSNLEFTSVDVGNQTVNLIPGEARARFNIRFNDCHSQASLKALVEARAAAAAGTGQARWRIDWEPSNADVFLTAPGAFLELVTGAIREVAGGAPKLSTTGGTSDARFIKNYCPVLELGLVGRTMHQTDECTPLADLDRLTAIYRSILDRYFS
jgi:succinyl-diaminopimelate desuccinylase